MGYLSRILIFTSLLMAAGQPFGKISLPLGKVEFKTENADWARAKPNQPVFEGNLIRTQAKSRCEITLPGGGKIRIGENSELELNDADVKPMVKNFNACPKPLGELIKPMWVNHEFLNINTVICV